MPQLVHVPGTGTVEFPDDFSEDQIRDALGKHFGAATEEEPAVKEPTIGEQLGYQPSTIPSSPEELAVRNLALKREAIKSGKIGTGMESYDPTMTLPGGLQVIPSGTPRQPFGLQLKAPPEAGAVEKVATGIANLGLGLGSFVASPEGVATMMAPVALGPRLARAGLGALFAPQLTKTAAEQWGEFSARPDWQLGTEAAGTTALGLLTGAEARALPKTLKETARSIYASKIKKAAEVHGDVRPQPIESVRQMPVQEGGPRVQPQTEGGISQEGQARLLLDDNRPAVKVMPMTEGEAPQYEPAERLTSGEWETHDQIIKRTGLRTEDIDRRVFLNREGLEKPREQTAAELQQVGVTTKEPGRAHSTDVNKLVEPKTEIEPQVQSVLDEALKGVSEQYEFHTPRTEVEAAHRATLADENVRGVLANELGRDPTRPEIRARQNELAHEFGYKDLTAFERSKAGRFEAFEDYPIKPLAYADLAENKIKISKEAVQDMLKKHVDPAKWKAAVNRLVSEEAIHLKVMRAFLDVATYWESLSGIEQKAITRIYLGKGWKRGLATGIFGAKELGNEAIRMRLQRLERMGITESARASGRELWTVKSLELLESTVRGVRETLGKKVSAEELAIIKHLEDNIKAAKTVAVSREASQPQEAETPFSVAPEETERPEVFKLGTSPTKDLLGNPLTTQYHASPKDWARWQEVQTELRSALKEKRYDDFYRIQKENEAIKNKYGGNVPAPPKAASIAPSMSQQFREIIRPQKELEKELRSEGWNVTPVKISGSKNIVDYWDVYFRGRKVSEADTAEQGWNKISDGEVRAPSPREIKYWEQGRANLISEFDKKYGQNWSGADLSVEDLARWKSAARPPKTIAATEPPREVAMAVPPEERQPEFFLPPLARGAKVQRGVDIDVPAEANRLKITPDEIAFDQPGREGAYRPISDAEAKSPKTLGAILTADARIGGARQAQSLSRRLTVLLDKQNGTVHVVSTYPHARSGAMLVNPERSGAAHPHAPIADLLTRYRPLYTVLADKPRQRFHQRFDSLDDYQARFGESASERSAGSLGREAIPRPEAYTSEPFVPPIYPEEAELPAPSSADLKAFHDFFGGEVPATKEGFDRALRMAPVSGTRQMAQAVYRAFEHEQSLNPDVAPEVNLESALSKLYEDLSKSPTRTEFLETASQRFGAGMGEKVPKGRLAMAVYPPIAEEVKLAKQDLAGWILGKPLRSRITATLDSASNAPNNLANQRENHVRLASARRAPGLLARAKARWQQGDPKVLAAANVLVESMYDPQRAMWRNIALRQGQQVGDFDPRAINIFRREVERGRVRAEQHLASSDARLSRLGRAELRAYEQYKSELDYADQHWNDPELQETAKRLRDSYAEQLQELRKNGVNVNQEPGFNPHRYEAAIWNGHSFLFNMANGVRKIIGERTLAQRTFDSYYHAFGHDAYLPVTRDSASLLGHYMRRTGHMIYRDLWRQGLKSMKTPEGLELAADPKVVGQKHLPHKPGYEIVNDGYSGLSVHPDYARLVTELVSPDAIEQWGPSRTALHLSQALKHSILVGDFFHLGRMAYYALSVMGRRTGFKSGWTVLDIAPRDMPEAVRKGVIRQQDMDWANTRVALPRGRSMTRAQIARKFYEEMGSNLGRVQDALYKDLITELTPTSGLVRRGLVRVIDPSIGRYNRFLFDRLTRGVMTEGVVREFERQMKALPNASPKALMRDIARDINTRFGNIGRQGWFRSKTMQSLSRLMFLAPQWVEGLIKSETIGPLRLTGIPKATGFRQGLTTTGTLGKSMGQAMLFMFGLTQAINLLTRGKPTWQNEEKGHKLDAFIKWGGDPDGFWFSPLAIFNEVSHDVIRLIESKPTVAEALMQIVGNKESPLTRAILVGWSGITPMGRKTTTTGSRLKEMGKAVLPIPISFGKLGQAALHQAAPSLVSPPPRGAVPRQAFATLGIKVEPTQTSAQEVGRMADRFMEDNDLKKETGWMQIQTDKPGYSKLRAAVRNDDWKEARANIEHLRKTHSDAEIIKSMKIYASRGFTGSRRTERLFQQSLTAEQLDLYDKAKDERQVEVEKFLDWFKLEPPSERNPAVDRFQ